jgi:hypothetical protein
MEINKLKDLALDKKAIMEKIKTPIIKIFYIFP